MPEFGTSGLRGLAAELTDDICATYAAAFSALHADGGPVFVGRDLRDSSPRIAAAVARGIRSEGAEVIDCGKLPTPALALAAAGRAAIMVTGSHIPADRNGLKFYTARGEFTKAEEAPLIAEVERRAPPPDVDGEARSLDAAAAYVARYTGALETDALSGLRVGFWQHSSVAGDVLTRVLTALGAEVLPLGASEGFVPVDTEAVDDETRNRLSGWVKEHGLSAVVSTDGDADRPLLADEHGDVIPGDILGPLTARWLGAETVVTTVSANTLVDLMDTFDSVRRTKIGSPYVIAAMEEARGEKVVGYEPNGGFLLGYDAPHLPALMTRDAVLPLVATLAAARAQDGSVSDLLRDLPQRRTATDRLKDIPRETSLSLVRRLLEGDTSILPDGLSAPVATDTTDGARLTFAGGEIVTVRPSGNAPELRCYVEADGKDRAAALLSEALSNLRSAAV